MSAALNIAGVSVRRDKAGRFSLNDLHKAAMARGNATEGHRPGNFMKRPETQDLVGAIQKRCSVESIAPVAAVKGGAPGTQGTYVSKVLVIAYAMWIDADFHLDVIEAFDSRQTQSASLWQRMLNLIATDKRSREKASVASGVLRERKFELVGIRAEKGQLQDEMEPDLFMPLSSGRFSA